MSHWTPITDLENLPPEGQRVLLYVHPDIYQAWRHGSRWEFGTYSHPIGVASHWMPILPPGAEPTAGLARENAMLRDIVSRFLHWPSPNSADGIDEQNEIRQRARDLLATPTPEKP